MSPKEKLQSLLAASNTTTGEIDTNLTDAVQTLIDGYGQGGSEKVGVVHLQNALSIYTGVTITRSGTTLHIGG